MLNLPKNDEDFIINDNKRILRFDNTTTTFQGRNMGGKITIFYQEDEKKIFKVTGHNGWYERGTTKYYPPYFLIGTLIGDTFTQYHEVEYTRKYAKQAKEKALELVAEIDTKEKYQWTQIKRTMGWILFTEKDVSYIFLSLSGEAG